MGVGKRKRIKIHNEHQGLGRALVPRSWHLAK